MGQPDCPAQIGDFPKRNVLPRLSETPNNVRMLRPELDQHDAEVYSE
ncbi:hypothetical protein [Deinococcus sp.]